MVCLLVFLTGSSSALSSLPIDPKDQNDSYYQGKLNSEISKSRLHYVISFVFLFCYLRSVEYIYLTPLIIGSPWTTQLGDFTVPSST